MERAAFRSPTFTNANRTQHTERTALPQTRARTHAESTVRTRVRKRAAACTANATPNARHT
eukprot:11223431-Lingulodinium_polyedra.AAC.1